MKAAKAILGYNFHTTLCFFWVLLSQSLWSLEVVLFSHGLSWTSYREVAGVPLFTDVLKFYQQTHCIDASQLKDLIRIFVLRGPGLRTVSHLLIWGEKVNFFSEILWRKLFLFSSWHKAHDKDTKVIF